jgi:methanogenic corrinoid protein MtbC1
MYQSGAFPKRLAEDGSAAHGGGRTNRKRTALAIAAKPGPAELTELARHLIAGDDAFRRAMDARLASGAPPLSVMVDLLAPAARELGRLWDNDDCDLIDVQRASGALQRLICEIAAQTPARALAKSPSIFMQATPGERHTLGVDMAETAFRGMGWRVGRDETRGFRADLAREWRDFIGFSLSCDRHVEALARAIVEARAASRNPKLLVVVGGSIFTKRPDLARKIGADFCVCSAELTVQHADALVNGSPMSHIFQKHG